MSDRYYKVNGKEYPSVTTILGVKAKPALIAWAVKSTVEYLFDHVEDLTGEKSEDKIKQIIRDSKQAYKDISEKAMDIGTRTHNAVECFLKNVPHTVGEDIEKPYWACISWLTENDFHLISSEQTVYNHIMRYAGTQDLKGTLNGKIYIIDLKTSNGIWDEYKCQVSAYAKCEGNEDVEGIGILRLDKETGMPEWCDCSDEIEFHYAGFLSALDLFMRYDAKRALRLTV